jgi:hypothetical protein
MPFSKLLWGIAVIYRPQFKFETPEGYRDIPHEYYMNVFPSGIGPGVITDWVPFQLHDDADFYARAITGDLNNGSTNALINFMDPWDRQLFSNYILIETLMGGLAGPAYILNEEVWCKRGSWWRISVNNPTGGTVTVTPVLRGVKRCKGCAA